MLFQSAAVFKLLLLPENLWLQNVTSKENVTVNLFKVDDIPSTRQIKVVSFQVRFVSFQSFDNDPLHGNPFLSNRSNCILMNFMKIRLIQLMTSRPAISRNCRTGLVPYVNQRTLHYTLRRANTVSSFLDGFL